MPLLDFKVWKEEREEKKKNEAREIEVMEDESNSKRKSCTMYAHYRKEMVSKMTIHARSAIHHNQQKNILTQGVIRIMKNLSQTLTWEEKAKHLEDLSMRMQYSGNNKGIRKTVFYAVCSGHNKGIWPQRKNEKNCNK